jgi:hypothetical protein
MRSSLLASADAMDIQTAEAYSSLDITDIKFNMYLHSRDEKVKGTMRTRPNNNNDGDGDDNKIDM